MNILKLTLFCSPCFSISSRKYMIMHVVLLTLLFLLKGTILDSAFYKAV